MCAIEAEAAGYVELSAEIETTYTISSLAAGTNGPTAAGKLLTSVVCTVGTNEWQLDGDFSRNGLCRWFFDGTNVYERLPMKAPIATGKPDAAKPPQVAPSRPIIWMDHRRDGCVLGGYAENIAWLAFCSGAYLKRPGRILPLPMTIHRHFPDGFAYTDRTQTFGDDLGLPQNVELFTSRALLEASVRGGVFPGSHDPAAWKDLAALPDGLLKFHYRVTQSTNFQGWSFPLAFDFGEDLPERYLPGVVRTFRGHGRVTMIRAAGKPEGVFGPNPPPSTGPAPVAPPSHVRILH